MYDLYEDGSQESTFLLTESRDGSKIRLVPSGKEHEGEIRTSLLGEFSTREYLIHVSIEENLHKHNWMICGRSSFGIRIACKQFAKLESVDDLRENYRFMSLSEEVLKAWREKEILCLIVGFEHISEDWGYYPIIILDSSIIQA